MGFFSGIGKIVKKVVRVAKGIVKGAIGTVKGALKGDPMAMASLAMMVYGGYQAGQFLFNKAAGHIAKFGVDQAAKQGLSFGKYATAESLALGSTTQVSPMMTGLANVSGSTLQGGLGAVAGPAKYASFMGPQTTAKATGLMPSNIFTQAPTMMTKDPLARPWIVDGKKVGTKIRYADPKPEGLKSFFNPKGLAEAGVKSYGQMRGATGYAQQQAGLKQQESYYENYMTMSQQMFERFGGGYAPFSASSTPKYAMNFNQKRNSVPPSFKPYFQYAAGTSNFGAATNMLDAALNKSYITQYA